VQQCNNVDVGGDKNNQNGNGDSVVSLVNAIVSKSVLNYAWESVEVSKVGYGV